MALTWSFLISQVSEWELQWKELARPLQVRAFSTICHFLYPRVCEPASYISFPGDKHSVISVVAQQDHTYPGNQRK